MAAVESRVPVIEFDERVFSLDCIKRAAYSLADLFAPDIRSSDGKVSCSLHLSARVASDEIDAIVNRFRMAVIDYDLREKIRQETEPMRTTILAYAYSKTNLQGSD